MRAQFSRSTHLSLLFVAAALVVTLAAPSLFAQQSTTNGAIDIGPRNPGTVAAVPIGICAPGGGTVKFPPPLTTDPNCIDISQPPSTPPQPAAGGAGNVVGGGVLAGLWFESINVFEAVASVQGKVSGEPQVGLGPAFNSNSCFSCHQMPTVGGTSAGTVSIVQANGTIKTFTYPNVPTFTENPELVAAVDQGASNENPLFPAPFGTAPGFPDVPTNGPSIEVRVIPGGGSGGFVVQPQSVAELFTIQGRTDATNCVLAQFPFSSVGAGNISFRIPTPTFGLGLVEATPDAALELNSPKQALAMGVQGGNFNRNGNDGTITRFGWKAQNKSLLIFAGEASNVEMGVSNELFPNEKTVASNSATGICPTNASPAGNQPEDEVLQVAVPNTTNTAVLASLISANTENNAVFMRLNAAPSQCDALHATVTNGAATCPAFVAGDGIPDGQLLFENTSADTQGGAGCALCHSPILTSGLSQNTSLSGQQFHPFSDFALHNMGKALADGIQQGAATSEQFRTAPLWGLGQRLFFLHDGRAQDLATAIRDHCPGGTPASDPGNESCESIQSFNGLTKQQQQDVLNFLRSL